jgi:transcriptional regulator with XRE-family HTH domain
LNSQAIVDEVDVVEIREIRRDGKSYAKLGTMFGVSAYAIRDIVKGRTWPHAGGPIEKTKQSSSVKGADNGRTKLSERQVAKIRGLLLRGEPQAAVARAFKVSRSTICDIAKGRKRFGIDADTNVSALPKFRRESTDSSAVHLRGHRLMEKIRDVVASRRQTSR